MFTANLPGRLILAGNSVMTCDRGLETAATCNAVELGEPGGIATLDNDLVATAFIDVDGATGDLDGNGSDDTFNSSTATVAYAGAVEWAGLYWWGTLKASESTRTVPVGGRNQVQLRGPGGGYQPVSAAWLVDNGDSPYVAFADVTARLNASGAGAYTVANVTAFTGQDDHLGGWALVVVNRDPDQPLRHVSIYDGYAPYGTTSVSAMFSGFLTPLLGPIDAQLSLIMLDGDPGKGDEVTWDGTALFDPLNPAADFANSSFSVLGAAGTLRQPAYPNLLGSDLDVVDLGGRLANGQQSATAVFQGTAGEGNFAVLAGFQSRIYQPQVVLDLQVSDVNGGDVLPGDVLQYTATITNQATALDTAINLVLASPIAAQSTYVPGSLAVLTGPTGAPVGALTDATGDDGGEHDVGNRRILARLGLGATMLAGGALAPGQSTSVRWDVQIDPGVAACTVITNQAQVSFEGQTLAASASSLVLTVMSQNGTTPGPTSAPPVAGPGTDSDGDGLSDAREMELGSSPFDADSDDDGLLDGDERSPELDTDGDGLINILDPDSDDDGLFDGTELGRDCANPATRAGGPCRADGDAGATQTDPLRRDTDGGGRSDGAEDWNLDGKVDPGESNPNNPADDLPGNPDSDGDGLPDALESTLGTDPFDADSDDDGLLDGDEPNPSVDSDGDGFTNPRDADSDGDGLFDGTEAGRDCAHPATRVAEGRCRADADAGVTRTAVLVADTDRGGVADGVEDTNLDGARQAGERDPLDPADDGPVGADGGPDAAGGGDGGNDAGADGAVGDGGLDVGPGADAAAADAAGTDAAMDAAPSRDAPAADLGSGVGLAEGTIAGGGCSCHFGPAGGRAPGWGLGGLMGALAICLLGARRRRARETTPGRRTCSGTPERSTSEQKGAT